MAVGRGQQLHPQQVNLNYELSGMQSLLEHVLGEGNALQFELQAEPATISFDPTQLLQVVLNLTMNAKQAMPLQGGKLTLSTKNTRVSREDSALAGIEPGDYVGLEVRDTGVGMDADTLRHVFEPFFTTRKSGTGLGLATVFGIVKQSGGTVEVSSEVGTGTVFTVLIPLLQAAIATRPADPVQPKRGPQRSAATHLRPTVLLADDDAAVRQNLSAWLETGGYHVLTAVDGVDALRVAALCQEPIDILLTDVKMPGLDGPELARRFAGQYPDSRTLFMSGYRDLDRSLNEDVVFLQKPFSASDLMGHVGTRTSIQLIFDIAGGEFSPSSFCLRPFPRFPESSSGFRPSSGNPSLHSVVRLMMMERCVFGTPYP